jgi:hypothetical protein
VAGDRGVRIRLPPPAGLSWCGALLSAVVRESTAPFLGSSARGTEGSNPSPSSGESPANSDFLVEIVTVDERTGAEASAGLGRADWFATRRAEGHEARNLPVSSHAGADVADPWVEHSADNQLSESIQPEQRLSAGAAARRACRAGDVRDTSAAAGPGSASGQRSLVLRPCATRPQRAGDRWRDRAHCRGDPHGNRTVRWAAIAPSG